MMKWRKDFHPTIYLMNHSVISHIIYRMEVRVKIYLSSIKVHNVKLNSTFRFSIN